MTDARIYERGYRRYDGPRLGPSHAVWSLTIHTLQRILGLKRPFRSKILPIVVIIIAYLPAVVLIGIKALIPESARGEFGVQYHQYYGFVIWAILLFVAFTAPESLCADRRTKSLSLYLAAPLNRTTYLLAKWAAVVITMLIVTVGPLLLLLLGYMFQSAGPDGPAGVVLTLARIIAAGVATAAIFASVATAVATFTDRLAIASAMTLFGFTALSILADAFNQELGWGPSWRLMSPIIAAIELVTRIFGAPPDYAPDDVGSAGLVVAAWTAWTFLAGGFAWWRYQRLQVTR